MYWYQNLKVTEVVDFHELIRKPEIQNDEAVIFFINSSSGFGSQLTLLVQYSLFAKSINPKLHCLGYFSNNACGFKYCDKQYNNSFFLYFDYLHDIGSDVKYYFVNVNSIIGDYPFIIPQSIDNDNVDSIEINKKYSDYFKENFVVKIGSEIVENVKKIKNDSNIPLIGIHIRSLYQFYAHPFNRNPDIVAKLLKIKNALDNKYVQYNIFVATDVSFYIDIIKSNFNNSEVFYNSFINRVDNEGVDIIPHSSDDIGFKLGSDILFDCLSLINCDYYYVSITNIAYITSFINCNNNALHFN